MKKYTEKEMYDINEAFQAKLKKEQQQARRFFYKLLLAVLGLLVVGMVIGYFVL